ncbi:MAG: helix-turn-helix transcriptional regulator [Acidobacteriaceae bacterium]|nr:helix-turn-helix transcriptional regulator [Acidobacteriaceae bacterium]
MAKSYPPGYEGYRHTHGRAQFLYAASGSMRLSFDVGCWLVPPMRAVWLPAGYPHQTDAIGALEMRTLYIDTTGLGLATPETPSMLRVSPLLHELVMRVTEMPVEYDELGQEGRVIETLLGEIDWSAIHPLCLPAIHDLRLRKLELALRKNPADSKTLEEWSKRLGISTRTLTRLVRRETNLSFQAWKDQIRTFAAIPMLTEGIALAEIADALGYETAWSFTAMFKRVTGKLPSKYTLAEEQARKN